MRGRVKRLQVLGGRARCVPPASSPMCLRPALSDEMMKKLEREAARATWASSELWRLAISTEISCPVADLSRAFGFFRLDSSRIASASSRLSGRLRLRQTSQSAMARAQLTTSVSMFHQNPSRKAWVNHYPSSQMSTAGTNVRIVVVIFSRAPYAVDQIVNRIFVHWTHNPSIGYSVIPSD